MLGASAQLMTASGINVAGLAELDAHFGRDLAVRTDHEGVWLNADGAQRSNGVLGWLGLQFLAWADVRNQGDVHEEDVSAADVLTDLACGFEERLGFDVADGSTDFGDDHVGGLLALARLDGGQAHTALDLIGDVRDDLHGIAKVVAAAFLFDDLGVDLTGGHVGHSGEVFIQEALVVTDVEVGFGAIIGDKDFTVLEGVHCARINIEIRV